MESAHAYAKQEATHIRAMSSKSKDCPCHTDFIQSECRHVLWAPQKCLESDLKGHEKPRTTSFSLVFPGFYHVLPCFSFIFHLETSSSSGVASGRGRSGGSPGGAITSKGPPAPCARGRSSKGP